MLLDIEITTQIFSTCFGTNSKQIVKNFKCRVNAELYTY
jgi:hypothetical protein